jgi:hypothetical protein
MGQAPWETRKVYHDMHHFNRQSVEPNWVGFSKLGSACKYQTVSLLRLAYWLCCSKPMPVTTALARTGLPSAATPSLASEAIRWDFSGQPLVVLRPCIMDCVAWSDCSATLMLSHSMLPAQAAGNLQYHVVLLDAFMPRLAYANVQLSLLFCSLQWDNNEAS